LPAFLPVIASYVRRGSRQMNQAKLIVDSIEGLCLAEEQVPMGHQVAVKVFDHPSLGSDIKIDKNIAAENHVDTLHEGHTSVVGKVQPAECDGFPDRRMHLQLLSDR